jgi:hypothetical protein
MTQTPTAALDDPRHFAGSFGATSWDVWRVFLEALEALPMDEAEIALYRHHTGPYSTTHEARALCVRT